MNSVIRTARIVAHCLAVWNSYEGSLTQEDKDFFDACVEHADFRDEFSAVEECIVERLLQDGIKSDQAIERAHQMVTPYASQWGVEMPALARAH